MIGKLDLQDAPLSFLGLPLIYVAQQMMMAIYQDALQKAEARETFFRDTLVSGLIKENTLPICSLF